MKKICVLLALCFLLEHKATCQTNLGEFNPFSFVADSNVNIAMSKDTSGLIWFASLNHQGDSAYITNEINSETYVVPADTFATYPCTLMVDSRNDIWVENAIGAYYRIFNGLPQYFEIPIPDSTHCVLDNMVAADNHHGLDYFLCLTTLADDTTGQILSTDSVYLWQFDGTNLVSINLNSILIPADTVPIYLIVFCDYSGNAYVILDSFGIYKYDGQNWTTISVNLASVGPDIFCTYTNQFFINDGEQHLWQLSNGGQLTPIYNCVAGNLVGSCLMQDDDSTLWLQNEFGLLKDSGGTFVTEVAQYYLNDGNCNPWVGTDLFDKYGNIFMSSSCQNNVLVYSFSGLNVITGTVFGDINQNGIRDTGEPGLPGLNVIQSPNISVGNTDSTGNYDVIDLDTLQVRTVTFTCPRYYHLTTPSTLVVNPGLQGLCCYDFGLAADGPIQDLQISAAPPFAIPGYSNYHWLSYQNTGTVTVSDTVTYAFDPQYTYLASDPEADIVQGNTLKWAYQNLQPFEIRNIIVQLQLDSAAVIGSILNDTAIIGPVSTDTMPADNIYGLQQVVSASFDPNSKTVTPAGSVNPGDVLTYSIYFQNTGTAPATNIVINDTLNPNLNFGTLKILGYSSPVGYKIKGNGIIQFTFSNIHLPDSATNPAGSVGYIRYSVQADSDLTYGSDIHNTGYVNFDYNSPVITNTTYNYYGVNSVTQAVAPASQINIYPNPATNQLFIKTQNVTPQTIILYDVDGRIIYAMPFKPEIDVNQLSSGVYFVEVQSTEGVARKRFVKM